MLTKNIFFKNFKSLKINLSKKRNFFKILKKVLKEDNQIFASLNKDYKDSYNKNLLSKFRDIKEVFLIGMGGSILGSKAIYNFLKPIKRKFVFVDNNFNKLPKFQKKKLNIIISKSGNTLETISNFNFLQKKNDKNIFIIENKDSYLMRVANKLKSDIIHHNNFIGGRYSVLSEVGMLPAEFMGLQPLKFRKFNNLIKNNFFLNSLILNVLNILEFLKKKQIQLF